MRSMTGIRESAKAPSGRCRGIAPNSQRRRWPGRRLDGERDSPVTAAMAARMRGTVEQNPEVGAEISCISNARARAQTASGAAVAASQPSADCAVAAGGDPSGAGPGGTRRGAAQRGTRRRPLMTSPERRIALGSSSGSGDGAGRPRAKTEAAPGLTERMGGDIPEGRPRGAGMGGRGRCGGSFPCSHGDTNRG
nr:translation initiation factor IF-2-like [Taeniopygia guttata]